MRNSITFGKDALKASAGPELSAVTVLDLEALLSCIFAGRNWLWSCRSLGGVRSRVSLILLCAPIELRLLTLLSRRLFLAFDL